MSLYSLALAIHGYGARFNTSLYSLALSALAVRSADSCRPPHAFGVLRIHGYGLSARYL